LAETELSPIRELTDQELPSLNKLVSDSFGYRGTHTFFDDFPIWKSIHVKRFGIFIGERLVSHAGIRFCEMNNPDGKKIPVAMVGAVATDENFRGQGLSSRILEHLCKLSEANQCDWTLLWGSEHEFYRKFGFELQGEQFQGPLQELQQLPENEIPRVKRGWDERIFESLMHNRNGIVIGNHDHDWIAGHSTVNWFYQDMPFAFVGFERGLDLSHIIHEFGGDEKGLQLLCSFVLSLDPEATILGTRKKLMEMGFEDSALIEEYLCLARPHSAKAGLKWQDDFWVQGLSAC
jgi:GNAT superfamily N-acetyltransferase